MCQDEPVSIESFEQWDYFNAYNLQQREKQFQKYYSSMNDVMAVANANPKVQYRYVVTATEKLPGGELPIWVKPEDLQKTYEIGYNDAIKAINNDTAYKQFKDLIDDYEYFTLRDGF